MVAALCNQQRLLLWQDVENPWTRCLEAIPCSGRTVESKNLFQKTEHKSCCKHDTFGTGIFVRVSPVAFFGRAGWQKAWVSWCRFRREARARVPLATSLSFAITIATVELRSRH